MTRTESITHAFDLLRTQCDPRGHDLLQALENLCVVENAALDAVVDVLAEAQPMSAPTNVIPLIRDYGVKA